MSDLTAKDLPPLPLGVRMTVTRPVRVTTTTGAVRLLRPGDPVTVLAHRAGDPLAVCQQSGSTPCRVRVPVSAVRPATTRED